MPYQFATQDKDYSDFSSGRVLYHQPGAPAFPDGVGDALARGFVEARWFASLCGSVTLVGQALFILDALCSIAEAGEYGDRVAESVGAAAGTVAFALKEPVPRPPAGIWTDDVRSAYREKASETQQAIRDTFANVREAREIDASGPLLEAVGIEDGKCTFLSSGSEAVEFGVASLTKVETG